MRLTIVFLIVVIVAFLIALNVDNDLLLAVLIGVLVLVASLTYKYVKERD
ncbi:hypothetical protein ACFSFY_03200 [Sporosarcina siberiensis]|uniref:Uncharacterized protein n=1 Tax=Sporosarcina siberiensis TaxID=1365606 RepID=A0ABW4SCR7_9BACL